jgi:hypothetical protein
MSNKEILIYPTYFPSISHYIAMLNAEKVTFEVEDTFQKQTNRNRMYIYSPNGIQLLNISVKHDNANTNFKDIKIDNQYNWQKNHFKSLEAAYKNSPFYEYFIDDLRPLFEKKQEYMQDLNFQIFDILNDALGISIPFEKTTEYFHETEKTDFRHLVNGKKDTTQIETYTQVFNDKHGFISNLSILDLLFNEGRYAVDYIKKQTL